MQGKRQRAEGRGRGQKSTEICGRPQADPFGIGARQEEGLGSKKKKKKKKKRDLVDLGLGLVGHRGREWQEEDGLFDASKDGRHLRHWRSETSCKAKGDKAAAAKDHSGPNAIYI